MNLYEIVTLVVGIAVVVFVVFAILALRQATKTFKGMEELTNDLKEKSKKLDAAFEAVEKISHVSNLLKAGYELFINKKKK